MLIDVAQVYWMNPFLGYYPEPTTDGAWGRYKVGGEKLFCMETARKPILNSQVSFCIEPLQDINQGKMKPMKGVKIRWLSGEKSTSRPLQIKKLVC